MMLKVLLEAENDFVESVEYYESQESGLGQRFRDEVKQTVEWIHGHPELPRLRRRGYRRVNLRIFPHYVAYVLREETVWIVAIAHAHRQPEFWLNRL